jgi:hypothetical protein
MRLDDALLVTPTGYALRDDTRMTIVRRSAAAAGLVLAILGFVACLAGTAGVWTVKARAQTVAAAVFTATDEALDFVSTRIARVRERLTQLRPRVRGVSGLAERLQAIEIDRDLQVVLESLRERLDSLAGELHAAEGGLDSIEAVTRGVQSAAAAVDRLEGVQASMVTELAGDLAVAAGRLEALRAKLLEVRDKRLVARELTVAVVAEVADLDARLAGVIGRIDDFGARVSDARASTAAAGLRVHRWIALGALALAATLVWFAASQVCVFRTLRGPRRTSSGPRPR